MQSTMLYSSIGSANGPEFDPHVWIILSWRPDHKKISTAILPLPLIQEEQLSVAGERMCTKYCLGGLPRNSVVSARNDLKRVEGP